MIGKIKSHHSLEILEARIAPAGVFPTIVGAENDRTGSHFKSAVVGTPILLKAGDVLTTGATARSGSYLMFVEKGQALVFTTDFNNNQKVDFNEITGIAAGDGLRLISFVDINGDIVTNLKTDTTLSDSDNNSTNDNPSLRGDGRALLDSRIEKIELRALRITDITDQNADGVVDLLDIGARLALSSFSIHGSILAGRGVGVSGDLTSGVIVDDSGRATLAAEFNSNEGNDFYSESITPLKPTLGSIKVGTAASGEYFSFGVSPLDDVQGSLRTFTPAPGEVGASVVGVTAATTTTRFNIAAIEAGDGGLGARGGNVENVRLNADTAGGYSVIAGDGGRGSAGGAGGAILNFQDLGSITGQILIKSGTGGGATTGAGGGGGGISFGTLNVQGGLSIELGDGGSGFTAGGTGASLQKAVVTTAGRLDEFGRTVVGTTHDGPHNPFTGLLQPDADLVTTGTQAHAIGTHNPIDFNNDGFGDIVFTTTDPEQLVVQFGDGAGGFLQDLSDPNAPRPARIYLDAPIGAEAVTVGDFNGDGHMDIAVGSSAPGSFAGITVFLAQYEDANVNGLTAAEDLNKNGRDDLVGFFTGRHTALPDLNSGDPDPTVIGLNSLYGFKRSGHAITDLAAGDFDGDGRTDLAVTATYYLPSVTAPPVVAGQVLLFFTPDIEDGRATGQFYANVGTKRTATQGANPFVPFTALSNFNPTAPLTNSVIEATAISSSNNHDVIIAGLPGGGAESRTLFYFDNAAPSISGPVQNFQDLGRVDTNRLLAGVTPNITSVAASLLDFTVLDFNGDSIADLAVITGAPVGFLVAIAGIGGGGGNGIFATIDPNDPLQNAGFFIGTAQQAIHSGDLSGGPPVRPLPLPPSLDQFGNGTIDEIAVLDYSGMTPTAKVLNLTIVPSTSTRFISNNPGVALNVNTFVDFAVASSSIVGFDIMYPNLANLTAVNYSVADPISPLRLGAVGTITNLGDFIGGNRITPLVEDFFAIKTGNGGDALIGRAGSGGSIGTVIDAATLLGSVNINNDRGQALLTAGDGGNGFKTGGSGGAVKGVVTHGEGGTLIAGDGGFSVAGPGGLGGDVAGNSVNGGGGVVFDSIFTAGDGGRGLTGGAGGSIRGNTNGLFDTEQISQTLTAGSGGDGVRSGGSGGSITGFHSSANLFIIGASGGVLKYVAGNGGSAVSGPGGNGGSVLNSSPLNTQRNQLAGDILLQGGDGGDGLKGGNGGSVDNFINNPDQTDNPAVLSFIGGNGGRGVSGTGGNGGNVSNISTPSTGSPSSDPFFAPPATPYTFNRILAGNGGESSGNSGGNGGSVSKIFATNAAQVFAVAAGAGGGGLYRGGTGGSVLSTQLQIGNGGGFAKAVIIAGEGGSASAFLPNLLDPALNQGSKAFGGAVGRGGDGGSIVGFTQQGGVAVSVDLIAGNGGDTVNFGRSDRSSFVGRGGSVSVIRIDGNIGNIAPNVPIKSYNSLADGQTVGDFVNVALRDPATPGSLTDDVGNVGLVTGASGRLKADFDGYTTDGRVKFASVPASGGVNGSILDVQARNIQSAVAGNVERIAAIQSVRGIVLTGGGSVGVNKTSEPTNYRDRNGLPTDSPVLDGMLIDGALVTRSTPTNLAGAPVNLGPFVFVIS